MTSNLKWALFVSGGGSTMQALLDMREYFNVCLIVTNRLKCEAVFKAKRYGIPVYYFNTKTSYLDLHEVLLKQGINRIFLTGYMRIIPAEFIQKWENKILNIHPSLLPKYKGLHAFEASIENQDVTGLTIHRVTEQMDEGEYLDQNQVTTSDCELEISQKILLLRRKEQERLRLMSLRKNL